jgi:hypothetical protein
VTTMQDMFYHASDFTNGGNPAGLNEWELHPDCNTTEMFYECPLDPLPDWYSDIDNSEIE